MNAASVLPFQFSTHLWFSVFSLIFFTLQYIRLRYKYQLILGIAIPFSMIIYLAHNKTFFYAIGFIELAALIACMITVKSERKKMQAMHTIAETMHDINDDEVEEVSKSTESSFYEIADADADKTETGEGWLDIQARNSAPADDKKENKPRELKTGWVDEDYLD